MNTLTRRWVLVGTVVIALSVPTARAQVFDGLSLYNIKFARTTYLKTNSGQTVNTWISTNTAYMAYLLPDSSLWRMETYSGAVMRGPAYGGLMRHYDWDGDIIEDFVWSDANHQQHHDINVMPNGHVLVVSWDRKTEAEARALGRQNITGDIWPDEVVEYDPVADSVVWAWHFWDHLIQDVDPLKPNYGVVSQHPELLDINLGTVQGGDWMHCNTVDYSPERDEVVITSHTLHEIYVIDHSTTTAEAAGHTGGRRGHGGDFLYRWGNPQNYDRGGAADQVFYVAHGGNWIRPGMPGEGDILVLNNGDRPGNQNDYSVVTQITPPLDSTGGYYIAPDSAFGPRELTWFYSNGSAFYSQHLGGAYRLPNGNTFAVLGVSGVMDEISPSGQIVWSLTAGGQLGRATKYGRDFAGGVEDAGPTGTVRPGMFACGTLVRYALPAPGSVTIRVFDAVGRPIKTLVDGPEAAGPHEVRFDAPGSGVFFAQMVTVSSAGTPVMTTAKLVTAR